MIQELISTSSPRCLNGNAGFGIVAQTAGLSPNQVRDLDQLSGYSHLFPAGDTRNPVAFLHVVRRSGGVDRHVISRVADCGNDYSGRTNRIGHHLIIEETDARSLFCGPVAIAARNELFRTAWNERSQELPSGKNLPNPPVSVGHCQNWKRQLGDAGWGGVVAEHIEQGDPISIIFEPGTNVLPLLAEAFALLPPPVRWKTTFSTFFLGSQEPPGASKIQIKCIAVGSHEMAIANLSPNTLHIDLRQKPTEQPSGKYVETARTGGVSSPLDFDDQKNGLPSAPPQWNNPRRTTAPHAPGTVSVPRGTVPRLSKGKLPVTMLATVAFIGLLLITNIVAFTYLVDVNKAHENARSEIQALKDEYKKETDATSIASAATLAAVYAQQVRKYADEIASWKVKTVEGEQATAAEATKAKDAATAAKNAKSIVEAFEHVGVADIAAQKAKSIAESTAEAAANAYTKAQSTKQVAKQASESVEQTIEDARQNAEEAAQNAERASENAKRAEEAAEDARRAAKKKKEDDDKARQIDAQKAEQEAAKKKKIEESFKRLPNDWLGITLDKNTLSESQNKEVLLPNSEFLWELNDRVKIEIVPFIDLSTDSNFRIERQTDTTTTRFLKISSSEEPIKEPPKELIAEFSLTEKGIVLKWLPNDSKDENYHRKLNRVLLSKLRIEGPGCEKEVALWKPPELKLDNKNNAISLHINDSYIKQIAVDLDQNEKNVLHYDGPIQRNNPFSISVVKKGVSSDEVALPENRLLLFRVVSDSNSP